MTPKHPRSLTSLLNKYADHTDKESVHHYGHWYDRWLSSHESSSNILELGCSLFGAGDLLALAEFFPEGTIVGVDISLENVIEPVRRNQRIILQQGNVYVPEAVSLVQMKHATLFDIIIDDCLHTPEDQVIAFSLWSQLLKPEGLYIIEDIIDLPYLLYRLGDLTREWETVIGDSRRLGSETRSDSILLCLKRHGEADAKTEFAE